MLSTGGPCLRYPTKWETYADAQVIAWFKWASAIGSEHTGMENTAECARDDCKYLLYYGRH